MTSYPFSCTEYFLATLSNIHHSYLEGMQDIPDHRLKYRFSFPETPSPQIPSQRRHLVMHYLERSETGIIEGTFMKDERIKKRPAGQEMLNPDLLLL